MAQQLRNHRQNQKYAMIGDPTGALTRNFENMRELEGLADRGNVRLPDPAGYHPC